MKRLLLLTGIVIGLTACGSDYGSGPKTTAPDTALVSMPGLSFSPYSTTISPGRTVAFDFPSESHNVIFAKVNGAPADIQETTRRKVARTFNTVGTFRYDCTIHPGMSGVVVVVQSTTPAYFVTPR